MNKDKTYRRSLRWRGLDPQVPLPKMLELGVRFTAASVIGLAITRYYAEQGHMVAVLDVNVDTGPDIVAEVAKEFPKATLNP